MGRTAKKLFRRLLKWVVLPIVLLLLILVLLLAYPQPFFRHSYTWKNFTVYSASPSEKEWDLRLQEADDLAKQSEWYDAQKQHKVFMTDETFYDYMFDILGGGIDGINIPVWNNYLLKYRIPPATLGHEMVHTFQEDRLGTWRYLMLPDWKREGYAYYIENKHRIDSGSLVLFRQELAAISPPRLKSWIGQRNYQRGPFLLGFAFEIKKLSAAEFHSPELTDASLLNDMIEWRESYIHSSEYKMDSAYFKSNWGSF